MSVNTQPYNNPKGANVNRELTQMDQKSRPGRIKTRPDLSASLLVSGPRSDAPTRPRRSAQRTPLPILSLSADHRPKQCRTLPYYAQYSKLAKRDNGNEVPMTQRKYCNGGRLGLRSYWP